MPIRTIIFDLGGVIINLDHNKTIEAFRKLGARNIESVYNPVEGYQSILFNKFEAGNITPEQFRAGLKEALEINVSNDEFDRAWNAMLLDIPQDRLDIIADLKFKGYNIMLFSNTNRIHYNCLASRLNRPVNEEKLLPLYFDAEYYSFDLKMRKPDPFAFHSILNENQVEPGEALFVDDTLRNIQGAQHAGLNTFYLTKNRTFSDLLIRLQELEHAILYREIEDAKKKRKANCCNCTLV